MWNQGNAQHKLVCDAANFDISRGHVLKYSIKMREYNLVIVAAQKWMVDLNRIDASGSGTLLDYLFKLRSEYGTRIKAP